MEEIGGYFELELCWKGHYHKNAILDFSRFDLTD